MNIENYVFNLSEFVSANLYLVINMFPVFKILVITSPPEGVARYCFHPVCLSVCLCVCMCVCVCVCVCPADSLVFYFSAITRDIDLKSIQDTYRVVLNSLKKLTFMGQRSRSQGRYIAF